MLTQRQLTIFGISTILLGIVIGLFIARVTTSESRVSSDLSFSTQSVGSDAGKGMLDLIVRETPCPFADEILAGEQVKVGNALADDSHPLLSLQVGFNARSFDATGGPKASTPGWEATLTQSPITSVEAEKKGSIALCTYYVDAYPVFTLRDTQTFASEECEAETNKSLVGFSCID